MKLNTPYLKHYVKCIQCRHFEYIHTNTGCEFLYYDEIEGSRRCNCLRFFENKKEWKKEKESRQRKRKS